MSHDQSIKYQVSHEHQCCQNAQKDREANSALQGTEGFDEELGHAALLINGTR